LDFLSGNALSTLRSVTANFSKRFTWSKPRRFHGVDFRQMLRDALPLVAFVAAHP
jgi:hypothetical protein